MTTTPFAIAATLQLPGDNGLPADSIPFNVALQFTSLAEAVYNLTGSGTQAVGMGTIGAPGALGLLIKVDPGVGVQPILVTVNSGSQPLEISAGGGLLYANPTPASGITALSIAYTTACKVRVWVLG